MGSPSPFQVANAIGNNMAGAFRGARDENVIQRILAEASKSDDPAVIQDIMGKILSQVSPERQPQALNYLQNQYQMIQEKKKREALQKSGVNPDLPPALQAEMYKQEAKNKRIANVYDSPSGTSNMPSQSVQDNIEQSNQNQSAQVAQPQTGINRFSDDQLVMFAGHPDKEVSEPAKQELKKRQEKSKLDYKKEEALIKRNTDISQEILKDNEKEAKNLIEAESSLGLMENAIAGKDLSFWSPDNLAEISGMEFFRSPEGALFKTAGKEFFLGTLNRAGARPNQFIEQQIVEMLPKIGRSAAANLSVTRAFRNEIDLKKEKVRLTRELANELEDKLGYVPKNIGQIRDQKLKEFAESKQKELNNDLRAFKAIEEKKPQPFMKVNPGTPITKVVAKALLIKNNNDPKKSEEEAKELGYTF